MPIVVENVTRERERESKSVCEQVSSFVKFQWSLSLFFLSTTTTTTTTKSHGQPRQVRTINNSTSTSMDTKVIHGPLKVRHVWLNHRHLAGHAVHLLTAQDLGQSLAKVPRHQRRHHLGLFRKGQNERPERRQVLFHTLAGNLDNVLGEANTALATIFLVFCLVHTLHRLWANPVDTDSVEELEKGPPAVHPAVGQDNGGSAAPEQSVLDEKAAVVAVVEVRRDYLGGHDQGLGLAASGVEEFLGEVDTDE